MTNGEKVNSITKDTLMPLSLIGALLWGGVQIGGSLTEVKANTVKIDTLKKESKETLSTLRSIESRLIRMESKMELNKDHLRLKHLSK